MQHGKAQFRVLGFPVRVDPSFLLVAVFGLGAGSLTLTAAWVAIVFATTLVHELGHAVAFRTFGRSSSITLWAFGGLTQGHGPPLEHRKSIAVSLAGPIAGMVVLGVPALVLQAAGAGSSVLAEVVIRLLVWVSIAWSAVNLLPVIPLDGGHVMASLLESRWGIAGARAARVISIVVAIGAGTWALLSGFIFAAVFCALFIANNVGDLARFRDVAVGETLAEGHRALDAGDLATAERIARDALARSKDAGVRAAATELSSWAALAGGRRADAARALEAMPEGARHSRALQACFLVADGERDAAADVATIALLEGDVPNRTLAEALRTTGLVEPVAERLTASTDVRAEQAGAMLRALLDDLDRPPR